MTKNRSPAEASQMSAILFSFVELSNNFVTFLENKIISIRSKLDLNCTYDTSDSMLNCQLDTFAPTSIAELLKVVRIVESKSHILDPQPASTNAMYDCEVVSGIWLPACFSENCRSIIINQEILPGPRRPR